ncbi:MAG: tetratricopeptide repeat protein, partial [Muribaculaceae bacterium]|nr:tetratricopeptide repeat protein [Muribaculaceae bacterium]
NPIKPEYANKQRGRIQNSNVEVEPEPMFLLSYYNLDNKLNGNTHYIKEITEVNDSRLLPATLVLVPGDSHLTEDEIAHHFSSIDYYNSLLAGAKPRAVDFFARGMDYLLLKDPDAAIADADRAIAVSPEFTLAYFLRANAHYLKYRMHPTSSDAAPSDAKTEAMLHQHENAGLLAETIADLDQVLKRSPKNVYALFDRGFICALSSDYTAAISCYGKAIEIKPDLGEAYYNRGLIYLQLGNKAMGVADLSKAGELGRMPSYNILKRMNN